MPRTVLTARPPRFFCPSLPAGQGGEVSDVLCGLDKAESHHARKVLRLSVGEAVELFDGKGSVARAELHTYEGSRASCRVESVECHPALTPSLTVASAVPKGPRADAMIDQLSQLGVDRFIPLRAEHSVAVPKDSKIEKFTRAAIESAKQCGRAWLMHVEDPKAPHAVWSDQGYDLKLFAAPAGGAVPDITQRLRVSRSVLVLIGPEGGWSQEEAASSSEAGCVTWSIAPHVLRIETAAAAAAAILRYPHGV